MNTTSAGRAAIPCLELAAGHTEVTTPGDLRWRGAPGPVSRPC